MAQTKPVSVPITPGVHEELSPHLAPLGTLTRAKNVRFPVGGEAQARPGTTALSVATDATHTPAALAGTVDYLCECPGGFLFGIEGFGYRYDLAQRRAHTSGSYGNAVPSGRLTTMAREELQLGVGTASPWPLSQAYSEGYIACLYSVGNGQGSQGPAPDGYFCEVYTEDGTPVTGTHQFGVGTASAGWVVADDVDDCFVLFKQDGTTIYVATLTPSASGVLFSGFTAIVTLQSATSYWAPCTWPGLGWALVWQSGALQVDVVRGHGTSLSIAPIGFAVTGVQPVSAFANATHLYVGWVEVNGANCLSRARPYNTSLVTTAASVTTLYTHVGPAALTLTPPLACSANKASGGTFVVVGQSSGPGISGQKLVAMYLEPNGDRSIGEDVVGAFPVSAPFNGGMIWARNDIGNGIPSMRCMLLDYQNARAGTSSGTIACVNPKVALVTDQFVNLVSSGYYGGLWRHHLCPPVRIGETSEWVCGLPRIVRLETHLSSSGGLVLADWVRFSTEAKRPALPFGSSALVVGDLVIADHPWGTRIQSDSADVKADQAVGSDVGFYTAPQGSAVASNTGPGQLSVSATYYYRIVIERIDAAGNRYRSAPSPLITMATGVGDDTGTVTGLFPSAVLRSYAKSALFDAPQPSRCVMHVYRTVANASSTGAQFYRATPPQGAPVIADGTAAYVDQLSDANLRTREFIYTDGGVLNNDHPASAAYLALSEDRVWLGGLFETNQLQSSKILVPGEGPQFSDSPAFRVVLPAPNTGVACQDGAVIAFTARGIYGVQGQGPTDQGQGAWDTPRVVTRSTGCIEGRSVLETSAGIFFQSARGLEILPRGMGEPRYIGMPVQTTLGDNRVTGAAVVTVGNTHTARFCMGTPEVLVFDLDTGAWSVDEYPVNVVAICGTEQGAIVALESVTAGGFGFYLENEAAVRDAEGDVATEIPCELEWAAIHPFTIAGWGRFNCVVGMFDELSTSYRGECTLEVTVGGNPASTDSADFDMTALQAPDFRKLTPSKMDGTYVRLSMSTTAGGWRFMGWTLDLDDHGGSRRMAASEQA